MFTEEELKHIEEQEAALQFDSFDFDDAYRLGSALYEKPLDEGFYAIRIILDGLPVFQALRPGAGEVNLDWLDRKIATVGQTGHSSLWSHVDAALHGKEAAWQEDEATYALYGGAFPIVIGGEMRGVVAISGLPHLQDHETVVEGLTALKANQTCAAK